MDELERKAVESSLPKERSHRIEFETQTLTTLVNDEAEAALSILAKHTAQQDITEADRQRVFAAKAVSPALPGLPDECSCPSVKVQSV